MKDEQDYYAILGVPLDAPEAEIRRAFRARAKELHPDSKPAGEHVEAHGEFNLLTEAYETLKDAGRRQAYDAQLLASRQLTPRAKEGKPPRAFAMGLALGLLLAAAAVGAKISYDRAGINGAPKSQESLRIQKAERPRDAAPGSAETAAQGTERVIEAPAPAPQTASAAGLTTSPAEHSPQSQPIGETHSSQPETAVAPALPLATASANLPETSIGRSKAPYSHFALEVLSLESTVSSDGSGAAAYRLVSLVNSANAIEELSEAASLASKPETVDLIQSRIAALKNEHDGAVLPEARASAALRLSGDCSPVMLILQRRYAALY